MAAPNAKRQLSLLEKMQKVFTAPTGFFTAVKPEQGFSATFGYFSLMLVVSIILTRAVGTVIGITSSIGGTIVIWVMATVIYSLIIGITHVFAYALGAREGFAATYRAMGYASTPMYLLGWLPLIIPMYLFSWALIASMLGVLWSLALGVRGVSILQNIGIGRAAIAMLLPFAILFIIIFMFPAFVASSTMAGFLALGRLAS